MKLHVLPAGIIQTNAYLLTHSERGEALLIDAPAGVWASVEHALHTDGCKLTALWLTHGHWDHIQGVNQVVNLTGVPVSGHPDDRLLFEESREVLKERIGDPALMPPGVDAMERIEVGHWLAHGETGEILGQRYEVRHVPGHCPGNVLFHFTGLEAAFVGDAIFAGSVGRTDLPGGDWQLLAKSIRTQIYSLPEQTALYPGHGSPTTVGTEMKGNPFIRVA